MNSHTGGKSLASFVCGLLLASTTIPAMAAPLTLAEEQGKDFRGSTDPLRIAIGRDMPAAQLAYLHFEIDAIDVSDFVQRGEREFTFVPQQPLSAGWHRLRVVALMPDGAIDEKAVWKFEVRASKKYRVAESNKQVNLMLMQRLATDLPAPLPGSTQAQGTLEYSSTYANNDWTLTSKASALYNSQAEQNASGEPIEVPDYQVKADWARKSVALGQQAIAPGSMILDGFNRRGISYTQSSKQERLALTGFATRTAEVTGISHITGLDDGNNLAAGAILTGYPIKDKPEALGISLVYLDSKGTTQGAAQIEDTDANTGGSAGAVVVDSYHGHKLWQLRGEYAQTRFDFDGINTGFAAQSDDAYSLALNYNTTRDSSGKDRKNRNWNFGVQRQRVGPWFFSQGNFGVTPDRNMTHVTGGYQGAELGVTGVVSMGEDNVTGDTTLPITVIDAAMLGLVYTPAQPATDQPEPEKKKSGGLFQNPSYSLNLQQNSMDFRYVPAVFTGDDVNLANREAALAMTFSGKDWNWTLSHSMIWQDDRINLANSSETISTGVEVNKTLNKHLAVAPVLQQSVTRFSTTGIETQNSILGATLNASYPKNWNNSLTYTVNRQYSNDGSMDSTAQTIQALAQYTPQRTSPGKFDMKYFTSASYQRNETIDGTSAGYQLFVGINITWPRPS